MNRPLASSPVHKVLVLALVLGSVIALGSRLAPYAAAFGSWVHELGPWAPAVYIAGYALSAIAFVPGTILTLAAGSLFGLLNGALYVFVGATLGACGSFLISRHVARNLVEERLRGHERFIAIDRAIGVQGLRIAALLRLSPVVPFTFLNYALGLTRIRFRDYALASFAMIPGTLLYVYYGKLAGDVAEIATAGAAHHGLEYYVSLVLGLAATLVVTLYITRIARKALSGSVPEIPVSSETQGA